MTFGQRLPGASKKSPDNLRQQKENAIRVSQLPTSVGPAPVQQGALQSNDMDPLTQAVNSRAFCYNGGGPYRLNKQSLANTTLTPIGATVPFGFPGAAAWVTTTEKMYVVDQASPFPLYIVDTITGIRTFIANCTGVPHTNFTGLTWDITTSTMYGVSTSITASQIFTVNITSGVCTPIGSPTAIAPGAIQVNAAPDGTLFSVDIVNDNLYRWNKATGVPILVGPLGINANFGQDGHFDISDGQYYWAAFNVTVNQAQLRIINTLTGASTLVGAYTGQVATLAIYPPIPPPPCTGTPTPGNTLSTANPACPNASFTLSTQVTPATGLTYQWQSAPSASGPWTNVGIGSTYTTSQTVATYYRATVTCGANSATSSPLQVTMNNFNNCYCLPTYAAACAFGDFIANVTLETLNNTSVCTGQFTYYSAVAAPDIFPGITHTVSVKVGPDTFGQWVGVWIDYNQDGIFAPAEFLAAPVNAGASGTVNINFTVPPGATLGTTRMRVRAGDDVAMNSGQSCGATNSAFGEAEDYNVNITPCVQGVFTSQPPATTTVQCSGNATIAFTATGSSLKYSWEYRVNASSPWLVVPNAAPYSGITTNTLTITNASSSINGYQYRGIMQGPCTAVDFTNIATLTVTPLVATVNPTSATICTGSIQALTLTNASSPTTVSFNNTTPLPIPDNNPVGVQSTQAVSGIPAGAIVSNVSIRFNIPAHTYVGDVSINLIAPNNVVMNLVGELDNGTGSNSSDGFVNTVISQTSSGVISGAPAPRTGTYAAERRTGFGPIGFQQTAPTTNWANLLTVLNGNWKLAIADPWFGDVGTLTDWTITITYGAPAAGVWSQVSPVTPPNTMFSDPAATIPYVAGTPANIIYVKPTVTSVYSVVYSTPTPCVSAPTNITVNVVNPVSAVVNPVNTSACVGSNATFTVSASGGPLTYQWQQLTTAVGAVYTNISGATSSTLTLTSVTQAMNGFKYRAVITASPCAGSVTSGEATLTVNPLPTVTITSADLSITPGQTTTITATSSPAAAVNGYSWTLNGLPIVPPVTTGSLIVGIDGLGTYQATVRDVNGCINTSNSLTIVGEASDRLWIYPNPSDGIFQVRLYYGGSITERRVVSIFKANGQMVGEKEFTLDNIGSPYMRMDFDLTNLAAGTYVVKVNNTRTGKIVSGLVVIQHK